MLLTGERIRLRALEPEDLELLYRWENTSELWDVGSTLAPFSRYILREYIKDSDRSIYESRQLRLMIEDRLSGMALGLVDLYDFEPHPARAACGVMIEPFSQGKGIAYEAVSLMMEYASRKLRLHQLYVHVPEGNLPSAKLFAKLGFVETGRLKDWIHVSNGYSDVLVMQWIA